MNAEALETAADLVLARAAEEGREVLLEHEVYRLLASAEIDLPAHRFVGAPDQVDGRLCAALPSADVVVKVCSADVLHKTEAGGIAVCPNEPGAVRAAAGRVMEAARDALPGARVAGVLIVEQVSFAPGLGHEILAGFRHDPAFGPVVFMGVGGLDVEYFQASLRAHRARVVAAASDLDQEGTLQRLRGTTVHAALTGLLRSARGGGIAEASLVRLFLALAGLARRHAGFAPVDGLGISELEVNPFVATRDGRLVALDGLARLHRPRPLRPARPVERLRHLLTPRSAVVLGASAESRNVGRVILGNLVEGGGIPRDRIWVVHPSAGEIEGCRAFPSAAQLPERVDLAVVAVAADKGADRVVVDLVEARRARTVTLVSGGFGETEAGREAEARMVAAVEAARRAPDGGVLVNGGNCLGIISVPGRCSTFFIPSHKLPFHEAPGDDVASISQSGAYLVSQISNLDRLVRPRYAISFGNQIDLTVSDCLEYLEGDPAVRVFAVYLEGFRRGDGARFLGAARRLTESGRPLLLYKAGRTAEGQDAAASHTAAAVGDYEVCRELVRSAGVVECATLDDLEDGVVTFSFLGGRPPGRRIAVLSNAGFECAAAADHLHGLELARLLPITCARIRELLPAGIVDVRNPVDATPVTPTRRYAACAEALLEDPGVDALVVAGVPATPFLEDLPAGEGHEEDIDRASSLPAQLIRVFRGTRKPVVFSVDAGPLYDPCVRKMTQAGLPCFRKADRATRALATFLGWGRWTGVAT